MNWDPDILERGTRAQLLQHVWRQLVASDSGFDRARRMLRALVSLPSWYHPVQYLVDVREFGLAEPGLPPLGLGELEESILASFRDVAIHEFRGLSMAAPFAFCTASMHRADPGSELPLFVLDADGQFHTSSVTLQCTDVEALYSLHVRARPERPMYPAPVPPLAMVPPGESDQPVFALQLAAYEFVSELLHSLVVDVPTLLVAEPECVMKHVQQSLTEDVLLEMVHATAHDELARPRRALQMLVPVVLGRMHMLELCQYLRGVHQASCVPPAEKAPALIAPRPASPGHPDPSPSAC
jgi:hypothetical protein